MTSHQWIMSAFLILSLTCLFPQPAMAYIGPGAGLCAIGAFLAVIAGIIVALFGFLWYPIRRLRRKWKRPGNDEKGKATE